MRAPYLLCAVATAVLTGCGGMVTANDGELVTIEHDAFVSPTEGAMETATKSCQQAGKRKAAHVRSVSKNPSLPVGTGVQVSTYRCD